MKYFILLFTLLFSCIHYSNVQKIDINTYKSTKEFKDGSRIIIIEKIIDEDDFCELSSVIRKYYNKNNRLTKVVSDIVRCMNVEIRIIRKYYSDHTSQKTVLMDRDRDGEFDFKRVYPRN